VIQTELWTSYGIADSLEGTVDSDSDGVMDFLDTDSDSDGIADSLESAVDSDSDGTNSDSDGIPDIVEGNIDSDGDGIPNYIDTDSDNDGIPDVIEAVFRGSNPANPVDVDGDGIPDYLDLDTDGDGILDRVEGLGDEDGDGIPDFRDPFDPDPARRYGNVLFLEDQPIIDSDYKRYTPEPITQLYTFFDDNGNFTGHLFGLDIIQDPSEYVRLTITDNWIVILAEYGQGLDTQQVRFLDGVAVVEDKHIDIKGEHQILEIVKELEGLNSVALNETFDPFNAVTVNDGPVFNVKPEVTQDINNEEMSDNKWLASILNDSII